MFYDPQVADSMDVVVSEAMAGLKSARHPLRREHQRVRIAAALLDDSALIWRDESSSHLELNAAASLKELLLHLHREHSLTRIVVSHDVSLLKGLASCRIALITPRLAVA